MSTRLSWLLFVLVFPTLLTPAAAQSEKRVSAYPWAPGVPCNLNPAKPAGLHPEALAALKGLSLGHRITQGINHVVERGNVHGSDGSIDGKAYTAAGDISVRCLSDTQIRTLLDRLADAGFAAWYRKDGLDGWNGPPHIHAVFAGCRLKPVLHQQVEDWLRGGTGLSRNGAYKFWQPSQPAREKLRELYRPYAAVP